MAVLPTGTEDSRFPPSQEEEAYLISSFLTEAPAVGVPCVADAEGPPPCVLFPAAEPCGGGVPHGASSPAAATEIAVAVVASEVAVLILSPRPADGIRCFPSRFQWASEYLVFIWML